MVRSLRNRIVVASLLSLSSVGVSSVGAPRCRAAEVNPPSPRLTVNLYNHAQTTETTLSVAKSEAARILRLAGIETTWPECPTEPELIPQYPDCVLPGPASLVLRIIPRSMARPKPTNPAAFGVALVPKDGRFGIFASVYIEAASAIAGEDEALGARMLGHLMSHELGHLLLGEQSHSRRGIMKADWIEKDLRHAAQGRFLFTARQASQMRSAVQRRAERLQAGIRNAQR